MITTILFDLDGTLVDSRADIAAACNVARAAVGLPEMPMSTIAGFVGDGMGKLLERILPEVQPDGFAQARAAFIEYYAEHCADDTVLYPDVDEMLAQCLAQGWQLGVVTNKPHSFSARILAGVGIAERFGVLVGGDELRKPSPEPLQLALAELGGEPKHSWMVGDHRTDIMAAHAAGMRAALVGWGIGDASGLAIDCHVPDAASLVARLKAHDAGSDDH